MWPSSDQWDISCSCNFQVVSLKGTGVPLPAYFPFCLTRTQVRSHLISSQLSREGLHSKKDRISIKKEFRDWQYETSSKHNSTFHRADLSYEIRLWHIGERNFYLVSATTVCVSIPCRWLDISLIQYYWQLSGLYNFQSISNLPWLTWTAFFKIYFYY